MSRDPGAEPPYPVRLLIEPELTAGGVRHLEGGQPAELLWSAVATAIAAEVGEPQGVCTIVFDLLAESHEGRVALRLDADPGDDAIAIARAITAALGERARASIKSLASDGIPSAWFPDLGSFEEAAAEELAR